MFPVLRIHRIASKSVCRSQSAYHAKFPASLNTTQGTATFCNVGAIDPDGSVTDATVTRLQPGISLVILPAAARNNQPLLQVLSMIATDAVGNDRVAVGI